MLPISLPWHWWSLRASVLCRSPVNPSQRKLQMPSIPGNDGRTLALELLLRLWQRSDEGPLQRAAGEASLLLLELPMELMSEQLPLLEANWIAGGETASFLNSLEGLAIRAWRIKIAKYEPVSFIAWP